MTDQPSYWNEAGAPHLHGHLGLEITFVADGEMRARLPVTEHLLAGNGFLHAGAVVTLADTCCGYGTANSVPEGSIGFTTIELKSNFLGTATDGAIECVARRTHRGRTTQVWDAEVTNADSGKKIALFRCTQMILYPRS